MVTLRTRLCTNNKVQVIIKGCQGEIMRYRMRLNYKVVLTNSYFLIEGRQCSVA